MTVNIAGSLILGVVAVLVAVQVTAAAAGSTVQLLVGTGLRGALTTCSKFSYETLRLTAEHTTRSAVANSGAGRGRSCPR